MISVCPVMPSLDYVFRPKGDVFFFPQYTCMSLTTADVTAGLTQSEAFRHLSQQLLKGQVAVSPDKQAFISAAELFYPTVWTYES